MVIRKLIDFLSPQQQQAQPLAKVEIAPDAEFDWPPRAEDLAAFTVVPIRADDGSERAPVSGFADVA